MKRRFVIGATLTPAQEKKFLGFLRKRGSWWHWIPNFWLFATDSQKLTTQAICNEILKMNPEGRALVLEFPEDPDWTGYGPPNKDGTDQHDWLQGADWLDDAQ